MELLKFIKKQVVLILLFFFLIEILLQISFYFDLKFINQQVLFYNGYCHQKYWDFSSKEIKFDENIVYHPILAYQKKEMHIPNVFNKNIKKNKNKFSKNNIALYGSSFLNHREFKQIIKNNKEITFINYALNSYGLDQIYLSYKLTSHLNQHQTIVFGFLLEDLDRSIFDKRDYNKPKFSLLNNSFELTNIPINQEKLNKNNFDLYLFKFFKNFIELLISNFDSRLNTCSSDLKKKLFNYFFEDIQKEAKKYDQKIIVITFNLKEDLLKTKSWRYDFIKNYLKEKNITHIDSLEILEKKSVKKNENIKDYFATDLHNNRTGFEYIIEEFFTVYNAI